MRTTPKILFIRTDRLGETLLTLPAIAALKAAFPQSPITLLANPELSELLGALPVIDEVVGYPIGRSLGWWRRTSDLARRLRQSRFDVALISNPKKEFHLATFLAGIPVRVGYHRKWGWLLTHRVPDRKALGERHEVEYNLDLVRALGMPAAAHQVPVPRFERERLDILQLLEQQGVPRAEPFLAVHPWTSNPLKQWPTARYQELIRRVHQRFQIPVVIIGGSEETGHVRAVLPDGVPVANLVGRLTLKQLAALLQCARLLVSNDSGPVHLAAAVGTRTVVLFGASSDATGPRRWGPWGGAGHVVITQSAMESIRVEEVMEALERTFAR